MQKTKAVAALVATLSLSLAGCASTSNAAGKEADGKSLSILTLWNASSPEGEVLQEVVDRYETETGRTVELTYQPGEAADLSTTYETMLMAKDEPDLILTNLYDKTTTWVERGATVPMTDYATEWGLTDKIRPDALDVWKDDAGQLRGLPYSGLQWPIWYNMDLLGQVGYDKPPATTDELIDLAGKLRAKGIQPIAVGGNDWNGNKLFLLIVQAFLPPAEAEQLLANGSYCDNPQAMKAIDEFIKMRDAGVFLDSAEGLNFEKARTAYMTGKAAMSWDAQWAFSTTKPELAAHTTLAGFPLPSGSAHAKPSAYNSADGLGVHLSPNGVKNIDAVKDFVQRFYETSVIEKMATDASIVPVVDPQDLDLASAAPLFQQAVKDLPETVEYLPMPDDWVPGAIGDSMSGATSVAYTKGSDSQKICQGLDAAYAGAK